MRLKTTGKVIVLVLSLGVAVGVYRALQPTAKSGNEPLDCPQEARGGSIEISVLTSETYRNKLERIAKTWNSANPQVTVRVLPSKASRAAMQGILASYSGHHWEEIPDIWVPSTESLANSLEKETRKNPISGITLVNRADSESFYKWPDQPMVVLARKSRQSKLRFLESSDYPFNGLTSGDLRFSFPDPIASGGGHSAMEFCLWNFKHQREVSDFRTYLTGLKRGGYQPSTLDSGPLAADFYQTHLDFILIHEVLADREIEAHPDDLYKIPLRYTVNENPVAVGLHTRRTEELKHDSEIARFLSVMRSNIPRGVGGDSKPIEMTEKLDDEKRVWEELFNSGSRLKNINE